ncbi:hypothetical protein LINPERPRIM_LOCUS13273 [Linum perenne]
MASCHVRSVSFPSSASQTLPLSTVQEKLQKLKADGLPRLNLKDLSQCIDDLLRIQHSKHDRLDVESVLDTSVRLLDMCSSVRDILSQMKQSVQDLESSLRRRSSDHLCMCQLDAYLSCRKKLSHLASKMTMMMMKTCGISSEKRSSTDVNLVILLGEVEEICKLEFKAIIMTYVSEPKKPHPSVVSISKLLLHHSKRRMEVKQELVCATEVKKIDTEMSGLIKSSKFGNGERIQSLLRRLEAFGLSIEETEEGLESLYRRLLKTRVLLLNILSN